MVYKILILLNFGFVDYEKERNSVQNIYNKFLYIVDALT